MSSDPKIMVQNFLDKNGFPFEMKVASEFQQAGFDIHQSVYYADPNTEKPRELDIIAQWSKAVENKIRFNVNFIVECKYARTPWILFSSTTKGLKKGFYYKNNNGKRWINKLEKTPDFENFFEHSQKYGYGITVTNSEQDDEKVNKDNAFVAIQTLLNFLQSEANASMYSATNVYSIYVPIIAIRGKLFEAYLDSNDDRKAQCNEISEAQLFYKYNVGGIVPKIHIVTEDHLKTYIKKLQLDLERLFKPPYFDQSIYTLPQLINKAPLKNITF